MLSVNPFSIDETGIFFIDRNLTMTSGQNTLSAYYVDDISGRIDNYAPDSPEYRAKAIQRTIDSMLPAASDPNQDTAGKLEVILNDNHVGKYLAFYVETTHPALPQPYYYFIFDSANENGSTHFHGDLKSGIENGILQL
jgi:hypothetical protein